ncbi:ribosome maturation factor RimP [Fibrivirga algicola]|uniref:ribosome maturation factor RimP n=1 Tax=Fibrivirga algicola TaxID=2950420 RepID=UPI001AAEB19C|nr:ribosome maturation factor RimP [Fibrivirga algicola]
MENPVTDTARIEALLQPYLNDGEYYIVDIQIAGKQGGLLKVTVLIDSDEGMTIEACARISRALGNQMDELDFFGDSPFNLEVSSPGVDFPLTQQRQFSKNVGRLLKVQVTDGPLLIGKLESVDEQGIVLDVPPAKLSKTKRKALTELPPEGIQTIPYGSIRKATVEIQF